MITYPSIPSYSLSNDYLFLYFHVSYFPVVGNGKGTFGCTLLLFCVGLGLIVTKTMSEALIFNPKAVLGYDIDNNLLEAHGWSRVSVLAQKTSYDNLLDKIRRRVGQLKKASRERMEPKPQAGTEGAVPASPKDDTPGFYEDSMDDEEDLTPEFIRRFTLLKWECLRTGVLLAVLQRLLPKPLLYKQLKENLSMLQIATVLSRQKKRHLKKHGKQEPLCDMPLEEYDLTTGTQQFAFENAIEAEQRWSKLSLDICHIYDGCHLTKMRKTMVEFGHTNE
jgi:hypothetical protein